MRLVGPLAVGAFTLLLGGVTLLSEANLHLPGNNLGYEPVQPIAYSHRLHAGELKIVCLYCHFGAEKSRHAGVPPAQVCMNCHATVTAAFDTLFAERQLALKENRDPRRIVSDKLKPLFDALAIGDDGKPDPSKTPSPIRWVRVHNLPDFVYFDHSVHVARGVACQSCHGPIQAMERVRQDADLSMGWCVTCHRANGVTGAVALPPVAAPPAQHVTTDCTACHY
jgi:hypothetical protein